MQDAILKRLKALNIAFDIVEHPPLFHETDADKHGVKLNCTSTKCLLLTNKHKSHYYLVILPLSEKADIKALQSVSLLSLFFADKSNLTVLISKTLLFAGKVGFHPNKNTATVIFDSTNIKTILNAIKINWQEL